MVTSNSIPTAEAKPQVKIVFKIPSVNGGGSNVVDLSNYFSTFEFKAMINGGYIIRAMIFDAHFNVHDELVKNAYYEVARVKPIIVEFQIKSGPEATVGAGSATRVQKAIIMSLEARGLADGAHIEFVAIDPPSWYLNMGDAAGSSWKGRVDQVIKKVVDKYAPQVQSEISKTVDSDQNRWWMMRMDPKTFISSLVDWSSSITQKRTHWLIASNGFEFKVKEQAQWSSQQRAYYRMRADKARSNIIKWGYLSDNALSIVQTKLVAQGAAAISGRYLDKASDQKERMVVAKDTTTENKLIAKVTQDQSFAKPKDEPGAGPPDVGWTSVSSIPEIYSGGDLGMPYDQYVDGRPRGMWLNMLNALLRMKLTVLGHGVWSDCFGLGVDTVFLRWTKGPRDGVSEQEHWWATGNWIVYGFHHRVSRSKWETDLYCARYDHNSVAKKVPQ